MSKELTGIFQIMDQSLVKRADLPCRTVLRVFASLRPQIHMYDSCL